MEKKRRFTWKKEQKTTGLASVGAPVEGSEFHDGIVVYARTCPNGGGWRSTQNGWYWVAASDGIPYMNTYKTPVQTEKEAKDAAKKYVLFHLNPANK